MRTSGGPTLTQEDLVYQAEANTGPLIIISPEVAKYMVSQTLPISVFNQVMASRGDEEMQNPDDAMFGTHIREAVRVIRGLIR